MIKFILKIFKFIFIVFIAFLIFTYMFSLKSNMSFESTISYFKTIGSDILNINNNENTISNSYDKIIVTSTNKHYYYQQLDNHGKIIYSALENNIDNLKKDNYTIDFSTTFNDLLNTTTGQYKLNRAFQSALDAFFYDHPEIFYLDLTNFSLNTKCISITSIKKYTVELAPKKDTYLRSCFKSEQEATYAIKQVEHIKDNIINSVKLEKNIYYQIKEAHDVLVDTLSYDSTLNKDNSRNIYGALIEKKVVCEGYAKAFKYLMDELGIECILVSGNAINTAGKSEAHMWNYVQLNGDWYGIDVTWDDPIIIGGYIKNNLRHDYFLRGRNTFLTSHSSSGKISETGMLFSIPILSDTNYKY